MHHRVPVFPLCLDCPRVCQSNTVRKVISSAQRVITLAGSTQPKYGDGFGKYAHFNRPTGLAVDHLGTVFVADTGNHCVRQIERNGVVRTLSGSGRCGDRDGLLLSAELNRPCAVAVGAGVLYVVDQGNHKVKCVTLLHTIPVPLPDAEPDTDKESINSLTDWYLVHQAEHMDDPDSEEEEEVAGAGAGAGAPAKPVAKAKGRAR